MRLWIVLCLLPSVGTAQLVSFGVIGGAPISPDSQNGPRPVECGNPLFALICGNNYFGAKPYAVGPFVEVFLPFKFSVEADVLYRRFHKDVSDGPLVVSYASLATFRRKIQRLTDIIS